MTRWREPNSKCSGARLPAWTLWKRRRATISAPYARAVRHRRHPSRRAEIARAAAAWWRPAPAMPITVNPGEVHDGAPIGDAGRSWRMPDFDPAVIAEAARDISQGRTTTFEFTRPVIGDTRIAARFGALFSAVTAGRPGLTDEATPADAQASVAREETMLMLLAEVMRDGNGFAPDRSVPAPISAARSLIDDDPAAAITLADLARESGLSRFQVLRGFVRATGLTAHAYILQRRIAAARRLIPRQAVGRGRPRQRLRRPEPHDPDVRADLRHLARRLCQRGRLIFRPCNFVQDRQRPYRLPAPKSRNGAPSDDPRISADVDHRHSPAGHRRALHAGLRAEPGLEAPACSPRSAARWASSRISRRVIAGLAALLHASALAFQVVKISRRRLPFLHGLGCDCGTAAALTDFRTHSGRRFLAR